MVHGSRVEPLFVNGEIDVRNGCTNVNDSNSAVSSAVELVHRKKIKTQSSLAASFTSRRSSMFINGIELQSPQGPTKLDPNLSRLLHFWSLFGLLIDVDLDKDNKDRIKPTRAPNQTRMKSMMRMTKTAITVAIGVVSSEVIYGLNLRQSKLITEQKRSTPLLTFCIISYCWLSFLVPYICDLYLCINGARLFRFYNKTAAKVCNGTFVGKGTRIDSWYFYLFIFFLAAIDSAAQFMVLGVWPQFLNHWLAKAGFDIGRLESSNHQQSIGTHNTTLLDHNNDSHQLQMFSNRNKSSQNDHPHHSHQPYTMFVGDTQANQVKSLIIDTLLGEKYAHNDLGVCIKFFCVIPQFIHLYAFFLIVISFSDHFANVINDINANLDNYEIRRLLRQLIILRDASEQISFMVSLPFAMIIIYVFMRQVALCGVLLQSTMRLYENWAVSTQIVITCLMAYMVFSYADGLQSASKQSHRLKIEQVVVTKNKVGYQSLYELLDYLNRLTKSIRITFFNIFGIDKGSLFGFYTHILTLTFVTS